MTKILGMAQVPLGRHDGAAAHVIGLYAGFVEEGCRVVCLAPAFMRPAEPLPFRAAYVPASGRLLPWTLQWHLLSPLWLLCYCLTFRPDVLYLRGSLLLAHSIIARLARIPMVVEVNSEKSGELQWQSAWRRRAVRLATTSSRITYRLATRILTVTPQLSTLVVSDYGADPDRCRVVSNGFDPAVFHPRDRSEARRLLGLDDRRRFLVFVARLTKRHSLDLMIDGFAVLAQSVPDADLIIVGDGPARAELEVRCAAASIADRVHFAGQAPAERVADYIAASHIGVAQLYADRNAFRVGASPIKVWAYLGCARPVLAGAVPNLEDILRGGRCGLVLREATPDAFAEAARWLLDHETEAAEMGESGHRLASAEFTWQAVAKKTVGYLLEVARGA